jgi:hypothetical protein
MPVYRATVDLRYAAGTGRGTNTWTLRTAGVGFEGGDIDSLMGIVQTFYSGLAGLFPTNSTFTWDGSLQELGTPTPEFQEPRTGWTVVGSGAASSYGPAPAMVCVTWRSSLASRRGRGRTFLGPLSPGAFGPDGTIENSNLTSIRQKAAALVSSSSSITDVGALAVWSESDQVARDFVGSTVSDQAAILRSRR